MIYDDEYIELTDEESIITFTTSSSTKQVNKIKCVNYYLSANEILEKIKLQNILKIFTKNETEMSIFNKINMEILEKKIFIHYADLPINVFIYVLYKYKIIIFASILYNSLKTLLQIKKNFINKKNSKFCLMINSEEIYNKSQNIKYYINGYYYLIKNDYDTVFINTENIEYFELYYILSKFILHRSEEYKIINLEKLAFNEIYLFNKIMLRYKNSFPETKYNFNFLLYDNLCDSFLSINNITSINNIITDDFYTEMVTLLNLRN